MSRNEPRWLSTAVVLAIHESILRAHGGLAGVRDPGLLESALARPKNLFVYESKANFVLAASYAVGIARNHPFIDGNKRSAFVSAVTFSELNGHRFKAPEGEVVAQMVALADRTISEELFIGWLRQSCELEPEDLESKKAGGAKPGKQH